jgi:hypothetical protein
LPEEGDEMMGEGDESEKPKVNSFLYGLLSNFYLKKEKLSLKKKKRKQRRDAMMNKKNRLDPNAPQFNRIPLPEV